MFDKYEKHGAYHWSWYSDPNYAWYKECVDRIVDFCQGSTLDVGCGDGVVANKIAKNGYSVVGIDNSHEAIKLADEHRPPLSIPTVAMFIEQDLTKSYDRKLQYMACLNVIEHLKNPTGLKRLFKDNITKAGIIITDMPQKNPSPYHVKEYSPKELADLFNDYRVVPFQVDKNFHGIEVYK